MKKLIYILLFFPFLGYSQSDNIDANTLRLRDFIYSYESGQLDTIIKHHPDSTGQFKIMNVADPIDTLDAVNLRTLWKHDFFDSMDYNVHNGQYLRWLLDENLVDSVQIAGIDSIDYDVNSNDYLRILLNGTVIDSTQVISGIGTGSDTIQITQANHGFSEDTWLMINGSTYEAAQADTVTNAAVLGVVMDSISQNQFALQTKGFYTGGTYTNGEHYFLSIANAGEATNNQIYEHDNVYQYLGTGTPAGLLIEIDIGEVIDTTGISANDTTVYLVTYTHLADSTAQLRSDLAPDGTGTDDQTLSIDSTNRVFRVSIEDGNSITFQTVDSTNLTSTYRTDTLTANIYGYLSDNIDSIGVHTDSLYSMTVQIYKNADSIAVHTDSIANLSTQVYLNVDSLTVHRTDINTALDSIITDSELLIQQLDNGTENGTFTYDASSYSIGAYEVSTTNPDTINIHNLSSGMMGTIYLNIGANSPAGDSITVYTYSDAGSTGLTEKFLTGTIATAANKMTTITYTCIYTGTSTFVTLGHILEP